MESRQADNSDLIESILKSWARVKILLMHSLERTPVFRRWMRQPSYLASVRSTAARPQDRLVIEQCSQQLIAKLFPKGYRRDIDLASKKSECLETIASLWHQVESELVVLIGFHADPQVVAKRESDPLCGYVADWIDALFNYLAKAQPHFSLVKQRVDSRILEQALNPLSAIKMSYAIFKSELEDERDIPYLSQHQASSLKNICQMSEKLQAQLEEMQTLAKIEEWLLAIHRHHHEQNPQSLEVLLGDLDEQALTCVLQQLQKLQPVQQQFNAYLSINGDSTKLLPRPSTDLFFSQSMNLFYQKAKSRYDAAQSQREKVMTSLDDFLAGAKCWHGPSLLMVGEIVATDMELDSPYAFIYLVLAFACSTSGVERVRIRDLIMTSLPRELLNEWAAFVRKGDPDKDLIERLRLNIFRVSLYLNKQLDEYLLRLSSTALIRLGKLYLQIYGMLNKERYYFVSDKEEYLEMAFDLFSTAYSAANEYERAYIKEKVIELIKSNATDASWQSKDVDELLDFLCDELYLSAEEKTDLFSLLRSIESACSTSSCYRLD